MVASQGLASLERPDLELYGRGQEGLGRTRIGAPAYRAAVIALAILALAISTYPLIRAFFDFEIDYNEGWNAYLQTRAAAGEPLYAGYGPLFFNNYLPLSFYLAGWLGSLLDDTVLAGRLLSLAALAAIAAACGAIVRDGGGSRWDARLATATCLLTFTVFATDYLGMNDPHLLGMAFATAALAVHLRGPPSPGRAAITALLLTLSLFTKHMLPIVPLLIAIDTVRTGTAQSQRGFFIGGALLALVSAATVTILAGTAFWEQLLAQRIWEIDRAFLFVTEVLVRHQVLLAVALIGLFAARRQRPAGLVLAYLALALAFGGFVAGGAGTDINAFFDMTVAAAIGIGLAARELRARGGSARALVAVALAANAGALFQAPLALGRFGVDAAGEMAERQTLFRADAQWLRAQRGAAICESLLLCFRAGKPMFYDSFNANQAMLTGRLPAHRLTAMLRRREVAVVQVSSRPQHLPDDPPGVQSLPSRFVNFEDDAFAALQQNYVLARTGISGRFYVPKAGN